MAVEMTFLHQIIFILILQIAFQIYSHPYHYVGELIWQRWILRDDKDSSSPLERLTRRKVCELFYTGNF